MWVAFAGGTLIFKGNVSSVGEQQRGLQGTHY